MIRMKENLRSKIPRLRLRIRRELTLVSISQRSITLFMIRKRRKSLGSKNSNSTKKSIKIIEGEEAVEEAVVVVVITVEVVAAEAAEVVEEAIMTKNTIGKVLQMAMKDKEKIQQEMNPKL